MKKSAAGTEIFVLTYGESLKKHVHVYLVYVGPLSTKLRATKTQSMRAKRHWTKKLIAKTVTPWFSGVAIFNKVNAVEKGVA